MTMFRPALSVRRLAVLKSARQLYDQKFNPGLNIIRGENSCGKSTIADFIFFAMGGDLQTWTPEAAAADSVHAEVTLNGSVYTLSRDVSPGKQPPLFLYEGPLNDAMQARDSWLRYPYSRSSNTESFSQVLFGLLGLPEQKTEAQQNITIHQLFRLLYVDQITAVDEIFRHERFDSRDIRIAVGELLLGIDDLEMHDLRLRLRDAERRYSEIAGELRSMFRLLGQTDHTNFSIVNYEAQIEEARAEQETTRQKVAELATRRQQDITASADEKTRTVYESLRQLKADSTDLHRREQALSFDLEDSRRFVATLDERLAALVASEDMAKLLGTVQFRICPACFQATETVENDDTCHLCKSPISGTEPWAGHLKMREELEFQLRESQRLIEHRETEVRTIRIQLDRSAQEQRSLESHLAALERSVHAVDAELEVHLQRIGYLDRTVEDLTRQAELAALIQQRIAIRDQLNAEIGSLKDQLETSQASRERRTREIEARVSEICVDALRRDLPQEETFQNADAVEYDFASNKMWANGRTRFSASSMTLLKNAFIYSLMRLSLEDKNARWPRFLLLDNIEDKGMQPERSANFQEFLAEQLETVDVEHQVILTTSMISPKLEGSPYCVGPYYTHDMKTLNYASA